MSADTSFEARASGAAATAVGPGARGLTAETRAVLLREYHAAVAGRADLDSLIEGATGFEGQRLRQHWVLYAGTVTRCRQEYLSGLPRVPLSRCPFTGEALLHSVDTFGLDGLWWDYEGPARPREQVPVTFFALVGAVRLAGPVAPAPFLCKPGPEVPYVVPRVLQHPGVTAVVSSLLIGPHQGYAIAYFASPTPYDLPRLNSWGTHECTFLDQSGQWAWEEQPEDEGEFDYDLAPWIAAGKLRWIAPGDVGLTPRDTVDGCPYLGLPGRRSITRIQQGRVWWSQRPEGGSFS